MSAASAVLERASGSWMPDSFSPMAILRTAGAVAVSACEALPAQVGPFAVQKRCLTMVPSSPTFQHTALEALICTILLVVVLSSRFRSRASQEKELAEAAARTASLLGGDSADKDAPAAEKEAPLDEDTLALLNPKREGAGARWVQRLALRTALAAPASMRAAREWALVHSFGESARAWDDAAVAGQLRAMADEDAFDALSVDDRIRVLRKRNEILEQKARILLSTSSVGLVALAPQIASRPRVAAVPRTLAPLPARHQPVDSAAFLPAARVVDVERVQAGKPARELVFLSADGEPVWAEKGEAPPARGYDALPTEAALAVASEYAMLRAAGPPARTSAEGPAAPKTGVDGPGAARRYTAPTALDWAPAAAAVTTHFYFVKTGAGARRVRIPRVYEDQGCGWVTRSMVQDADGDFAHEFIVVEPKAEAEATATG